MVKVCTQCKDRSMFELNDKTYIFCMLLNEIFELTLEDNISVKFAKCDYQVTV